MTDKLWLYSSKQQRNLEQQRLDEELEEVKAKRLKHETEDPDEDEWNEEKLDEVDSDVEDAETEKLYMLVSELKDFSEEYLDVDGTNVLLGILRRHGLLVPSDQESLNEFDGVETHEPATLLVDGEAKPEPTNQITKCNCQSKVLSMLETMDAKLDTLRRETNVNQKTAESLVSTKSSPQPAYSFPLDQTGFVKLQNFIHISKDNYESVMNKIQDIKNKNFSPKRSFDENFRRFMKNIFDDRFFMHYWCGNHKDKKKLQDTTFFKDILTSALFKDVNELSSATKKYQNDTIR